MEVNIEYQSIILSRVFQDQLWDIYTKAYKEIDEQVPCRQRFYEDEFYKALEDRELIKIVAYDELKNPIGLALITNNLRKISWISMPYFQKNYPLHLEENKLFYIQSWAADPESLDEKRAGFMLLRAIIAYVTERKGLGAYDCSQKMNNKLSNFARIWEKITGSKFSGSGLIDQQMYFVLNTDYK
jgi:hypothetical protein